MKKFIFVLGVLCLPIFSFAKLITKTERPPNYETPTQDFDSPFTPNSKFFVRYHLAGIPKVNEKTWELKISGEAVDKPLSLNLEQLKKEFKAVEVPAVAVCAGNGRGKFVPHFPGVQWNAGAMGNAKWKGVRLKDILERSGLKKEALEVIFNGADLPVVEKTPDFVKSLPLSKALDDNTILAYEMNGQPLPQHQGFPLRLVVPGWAATYWMKHLVDIQVTSKPFDGFWMKTGYRIPKDKFPTQGDYKSQENGTTAPVTRLVVNSLVTNLREEQKFKKDEKIHIKGVSWDGGSGIKQVEISDDEGKTWSQAVLEKDYGPYSWRQFHFDLSENAPGDYVIMARATNLSGEAQNNEAIPNPSGYHYNAIQRIKIKVK